MKIIRVESVCVDSNLSCMGEVGVQGKEGGGGVLGDCPYIGFHHYCHTIKAEW